MYAYKKLTAQDKAITPFNAHKQYDFDSASCSNNKIDHYNAQWTSESISLYTSTSAVYGGDVKNVLKYNQLDHLFYREFPHNHSNTLGSFHYLKQKRNLYEKVNILSIPTGLYGYEIKPGSFYLKTADGTEVVDDLHGNLIISGTFTSSDFPIDVRENVFKLDPVKAFKDYDLGVYKDYALKFIDPQDPTQGIKKVFYKRGEIKANSPSTYSTPDDIFEIDDSYFYNSFKYNRVNFHSSSLKSDNAIFNTSSSFSSIVFDSITGSNVVSEHNERYNFNRDDDFAISFYMEPRVLSNPPVANAVAVGDNFQGGIVFHIDNDIVYIVHQYPVLDFHGLDKFWGPGGVLINGASSTTIGEGETFTQNMVTNDPNGTFLGSHVQNSTIGGYNDWWLPSVMEIDTFLQLPNFNTTFYYNSNDTFNDLGITGLGPNTLGSIHARIVSSNDSSPTTVRSVVNDPFGFSTFNNFQKSFPLTLNNNHNFLIYLVRKANLNTFDSSRRYIIAKSTTKSVIPTVMKGRSEVLNMDSIGGLIQTGSNMQPKGIPAEPQFPYEVYMVSQSLHFDRSDGEHTISLSCEVTGSNGSAEKLTHILCQTSASNMELYFDGVLRESSSLTGSLKKQTRNRANLYIGSKGEESKTDGFDPNYHFKYFNGKLTAINIYEEAFNQTEVQNVSESFNGSPYIGNIFYRNGFATITHPKYHDILSGSTGNGVISKLKFQGTHQMYEHEYQCTINEREFNQTSNLTTREVKSNNNYKLAGFTTSSFFKPYVTTVGLYNEAGDLLVVGKLSQPVRMSNETDTTFVLRWDT